MAELTRTPDDQTFYDDIEGYCGKLSYEAGDAVELHVSSRSASFSVQVERWGATRDAVVEATSLRGEFYPPPDTADSNGCGWPVATTFDVTDEWSSGFYLVTLTADGAPAGRDVSHACFVVRSPLVATAAGDHAKSDRADWLYVVPTNTWNAYNTWGGKSLYTGGNQVSFARPFARGMLSREIVDRDDRKARPTRFREVPDADGLAFQDYRTTNNYPSAIGSTGWFTHGRRFVEWAEAEGHRFDYAVSSDLEDTDSLNGYLGVILVGHDEYWSAPARRTLEAFVEDGGTLASFSGNTIFWQVRLEDGEHGQRMVGYKYNAHEHDPARLGDEPTTITGMWADPDVGQPEWTLLGAGSAFGLYHRFG